MSFNGIDRDTGQRVGGIDHLKKSVTDILTTPIGTRVMRREYGSRLFELIDAPMSPTTFFRVYGAVAEALDRWEPRLRLSKVLIEDTTEDGNLQLGLEGEYLPDGETVNLTGILV